MRRFAAGFALAASLFMATIPARAAVIGFGNTSITPLIVGDTYVESGFRFQVVSGSTWAIPAVLGNPGSELMAGYAGAIGVGDTISITRVGGGMFSFAAVDFAGFSDLLSQSVNLIGRVAGSQTEAYLGLFTSGQSSYQTLNPGFGAPIDELRIVGAAAGNTNLLLDNFVLAEIPEPATLGLFGFSLAGLALARRRKGADNHRNP